MGERGITPEQAKKIREAKGIEETKLQKLRVKKGLSQGELAAVSNVKKRSIQCYEQETRSIDNARLETLCDLSIALDCKIEDLLESKELITKLRMTK